MNPKRVLVIGIDAATFEIINPLIKAGQLPHLASIQEKGVCGVLTSTIPPHTGASFATFLTGVNSGKHSIFHFTQNLHSDNQPLINYTKIQTKTLLDIFNEYKKKIILVAVPLTFPPPPVEGVILSSGRYNVEQKSDIGIYPPQMEEELLKIIDSLDKEKIGAAGINLAKAMKVLYKEKAYNKLIEKEYYVLDKIRKVTLYLLKKYKWEFFMVHFWITDPFQHFFWKFMDEKHIAFDSKLAPLYKDVIFDVYRKVDSIIGEMMSMIEDEVTVLIFSDHGAAALHRKFNSNRWLEKKGLLEVKKGLSKGEIFEVGYTTVERALGKIKLAFMNEYLSPRIKSLKIPIIRKRFLSPSKAINFSRTKAYTIEIGININLKGREPYGIVEPGREFEELIGYITNELYQLKDPQTGKKVVEKVMRKEELFHGPFVADAPDLFLFFKEDYFCISTTNLSPRTIFTKLTKKDLLCGQHAGQLKALQGILMAKGPFLKSKDEINEARIIDMTPTILYLLGLPIMSYMEGRVLEEMIRPEYLQENPITKKMDDGISPREKFSFSSQEEEEIKKQLKGLGYIA